MRHSLPIAPQFYVTAPQVCPYLDGQMERKLFTALQGENAQALNDTLSKQGFRRSQNVLYRPSCANCQSCLSARINLAKFKPSKSQRRCQKRNRFLVRRSTSPWATEEQYELFRRYLDTRHATGGMADMDVYEFASKKNITIIRMLAFFAMVVVLFIFNINIFNMKAWCLTTVSPLILFP